MHGDSRDIFDDKNSPLLKLLGFFQELLEAYDFVSSFCQILAEKSIIIHCGSVSLHGGREQI